MLTKHIFICLPILGLAGCMVGPDFHKPDPPKTETYTEETLPHETVDTPDVKGGHAQVLNIGQNIPEKWWELFESPKLNDLIIHGLKNSPNLKAAEATLREAQEDLRALIGATLYPSVGLELDTGREQYSAYQSLQASPGTVLSDYPIQILDLYNANVSVSYVFDMFGGNRRAIEALRAGLDFEQYQLQATYLTLTGNIVTTAILEGALRAQIQATKEMIAQEAKLLAITQKQFQAGSASQFDVLAQETVLAQTLATLPPLENTLAQTRHALAVLVGDYPGTHTLPEFYLDDLHLPEELPVSVPSALINQRPDIKSAEALLHQASAQVGVATANLLPTFPIIATYGADSDTLSDFFSHNNIYWDWQASVLQPIFNGGSLEAQRQSAIAAFKAALAEYEAAVLMGLQNVADSLTALESDARTLKETAEAETATKKLLDMTEKQFEAGAADFIDLVYAQVAYQQTYLDRIAAQAARYADTAALFQALGGPWWNETKEEKDEDQDED